MIHSQLFPAIEHMAQGLAYWMGYRQECYASHRMKECVAVEEAVKLLQEHLNSTEYKVKCEVKYSELDSLSNVAEYADVVIEHVNKDKIVCPICILEFKMSDSKPNEIKKDLNKMMRVKNAAIDKYEIILFQEKTSKLYDRLCKDSHIRRNISFDDINLKGRRFCKAWESPSSGHPSVAILELPHNTEFSE